MNSTSQQAQPTPQRLAAVQKEIDAACLKARRDPSEITLVTVTKTADQAAIESVLVAGQYVFGENRVQEAKAKWPALLERFPGTELHLIGPLQSNKVKDAVALFDAIHSIDRPKLCDVLAKEMLKQGRRPLLLVEVNTGSEPQKAGVLPQDADDFLTQCRNTYGLDIAGLMCLPPFN
jgi:pyridoxal phosphate enzyme (YggS family)